METFISLIMNNFKIGGELGNYKERVKGKGDSTNMTSETRSTRGRITHIHTHAIIRMSMLMHWSP